jgi:Icc protein
VAVSSAGSRAEQPVRIIHLTDTHLFAAADGRLQDVNTRASLESVVSDVGARAWPADLVAATGDISHDEPAGAYEAFRDILAPLATPVYCVPGNHDLRAVMADTVSRPPFHYCESLTLGNWHIVGVDSCKTDAASGRVDQAELDRLARELRETDRPHAAVCLHHPPLPMQSRWLDAVGLENADAFLDVLAAAGNVRAVLFGHVHQAFDEVRGTARIIGTPSTCAQFLPQSETFALDRRPPAYRRVSLLPDGRVDTELFWIDGDE